MRLMSCAQFSAALAAGGLIAGATALPAAADSPVTSRQTTQLRTSAKSTGKAVASLKRGQTVTAVSSASGWTKVRFAKSSAFVRSSHVARGVTYAPPRSITGTGSRVITASLNLRRGPGNSFTKIRVVADGTRVRATGKSTGGFSEVISGPSRGWMSNRYLARSNHGLPESAGVRVAKSTLNVRVGSSSTGKVVGTISKGSQLHITGLSRNGRSEILYRGATRWVATSYLALRTTSTPPAPPASPTPPTTPIYAVEKGLTPRTIAVHREVRAAWPQIKTIYGNRVSSGDHGSGRALDLMIPGYKTTAGKQLGGQIAAWSVANLDRLNINYVIWNQHIYSGQRASEGWRPMAGRGSDSANHLDHVHISVLAE